MVRRLSCGVPLLAALAACGGGSTPGIPSGPSSNPTSRPTPAVYATLAPPSSRQGDIKTLAVGGGNSSSIAYWPDNNVVAVSAYKDVVNGADGTVLAQPSDGNEVTAMTYSTATHSLVFASARNVYALDTSGSKTNLASNFTDIIALAAGSDGTIYAFDADHIVKIHDGAVSNVTAPGSFPPPSYIEPSLAVSPDGTLWLSDFVDDVIDRVTASGMLVPFAGSCKPGPDGITGQAPSCWRMPLAGTGSAANFSGPGALAFDAATNTLYVADKFANQLWAISSNGSAAPVAGNGGTQNLDGNGLAAFLNRPIALAFQPATQSVDILEYGAYPGQQIVAYSTTGSAAPPYTSPAMPVYMQNDGLMLNNLAVALDGGAWSADLSGANIMRISPTGGVTAYSAGGVSATGHVAVDAAGNAWYTAAHLGNYSTPIDAGLLKVTPSGAQTYFIASPQQPGAKIQALYNVTIGSDGNPWFTESEDSTSGGSFGFINASTQAMTQYATSAIPLSISQAPTGVAFETTMNWRPGIQFASQNGQLGSFYQTLVGGVDHLQYRASDSTIWFESDDTISSMDASGTEHDYTVCSGCTPVGLTIGPDGSVWGAGDINDAIIRVTPSGEVLHYVLPLGDGIATAVAARADGKLWVYDKAGVLFLFDPAAYDAMNDPHTTVPSLATNTGLRISWRKY